MTCEPPVGSMKARPAGLALKVPPGVLLALAVVLAPLALAEEYGDPAHDEAIGFPPGPAVGNLAGCRSPSADIVGVSIGREGGDVVTRVQLLDRDAPLTCGAVSGAWRRSSAYLEVYTEDLSSSLNIVVDSFDPYVYGDPDAMWRVSVALYVGDDSGAGFVGSVPAADLWDGDVFEVRIPATGESNGVPYDATGLKMHGYVDTDSWTAWPFPAGTGGFVQRSRDHAEIPLVTL